MHLFRKLYRHSCAALLLLAPAFLFPDECLAQQEFPKTYEGIANYVTHYKDGSKNLRQVVILIRNLPPDEDSLDWLAGKVFPHLDRIKEDPYLPMIVAQIFTNTYYAVYTNLDKSKTYQVMEMGFAQKDPEPAYVPIGYAKLCFLYLEMGQLDSAIICAKKAEQGLTLTQSADHQASLYRQLSIFYSQARMYPRSLYFAQAGLANNARNGIIKNNHTFYGTLALLKEQEIAPHDTIIRYLNLAIQASIDEQNAESLPVFYRNLASQYSKMHSRDSAEKYFDLAKALFEENPYAVGQFQLGIEYADHLINFSELAHARQMVDSLQSTLEPGDHYHEGMIYFLRIRLALRENNVDLVESYLGSYDSLINLDYSQSERKIKEEMATRFETEQKESENQRLQHENTQYKALWIIAIVLVVALIAILSLFLLNRKKERALVEKETENLLLINRENELKLKAREAENRYLQNTLKENIERVLHQQAANQQLLAKVEELKEEQSNPVLKRKTNQIQQLVKSQYSEDLLHEIEEKAKIAYPDLHSFLQENLSDRNRLETMYCLMLVLEYSTEEIMTLCQRSEKAIKSMRYRIRKRLELDDAISLSEFLKIKADKTAGLRKEDYMADASA